MRLPYVNKVVIDIFNVNLEDSNCPRFRQLPPVEAGCPYWHMKGFSHCAVQKAEAYAKFLESL